MYQCSPVQLIPSSPGHVALAGGVPLGRGDGLQAAARSTNQTPALREFQKTSIEDWDKRTLT